MTSPDLTAANVEKLADLFPTVITESVDADGNPVRAVDFDLLRQELSDHMVEGPQERYQLDWPGKRAAAFAANAPIAKTLRPVREESVDFDTTKNLFIEGDNLDALKLLQESYLGKVKLIYIDPPYNTGSDLVYADDYRETTAEHLEASGQLSPEAERLVANLESNGRFHSNWLSMMFPRLKLARNLLSADGIIWVSIDDNESASLRKLMDEVFGASNFFAEMVVVRAEGGGLAKRVVKGHDYLVGYTREAESFPGMFRAKDIRGEIVSVDDREYWIETDWLRAVFGQYGTLAYEDIEAVKGLDKKREIDAGLAAGIYRLIPKGGGHIVGRLRPLDEDGSKFYSVIKHLNSTSKDALIPLGMEGVFSNPKPLSLVKELVMGATRFSKNHEQIILDFFAGSGTTGHAVVEANREDGGNRRYICVQWPEDLTERVEQVTGPAKKVVENAISMASELGVPPTLAEITKERLRRIGTSAAKAVGTPDIGFRVLKVDSTNMVDLLQIPDEAVQQELAGLEQTVKSGRTGIDLLFQVLLDWGLDPSEPIAVEEIGARRVLSVSDGALIACFSEDVTDAVVKEIATRHPLRAVFLDAGFASDAARINAEQIFREVSPETEVRAI
jgi:adenine-specific DNA-methyltransferase